MMKITKVTSEITTARKQAQRSRLATNRTISP
jgi:hypothetical protein